MAFYNHRNALWQPFGSSDAALNPFLHSASSLGRDRSARRPSSSYLMPTPPRILCMCACFCVCGLFRVAALSSPAFHRHLDAAIAKPTPFHTVSKSSMHTPRIADDSAISADAVGAAADDSADHAYSRAAMLLFSIALDGTLFSGSPSHTAEGAPKWMA